MGGVFMFILDINQFRGIDFAHNNELILPFKKMLLSNSFLMENLQRFYNQPLLENTLLEGVDKNYYILKQTWDITTDHYCFSPVAFSYMRINLNYFHSIEEGIPKINEECHLIVDRMIESNATSEISQCIGFPNYGRVARLMSHAKLVADLIEFISVDPHSHEKPVLEYIREHLLSTIGSSRKIEDVLHHIKGALEIDVHTVLQATLPLLSPSTLKQIENLVQGVEHIAFIVYPETSLTNLDHLALKAGFANNHQVFPSAIVAKELGSLIGKDQVPTQIFKAWGHNERKEKIGIEIFIPHEQTVIVNHWILEGIGTHIALRVKNKDSLPQIQDILIAQHMHIPEFMHNQPMQNEKEGSITLYFDTDFNHYKLRLEFYWKDEGVDKNS